MNQLLEDLVKVLTLERLERDLFRGESRDIGSPQVFGGQVLGQALVAASATVENRPVHSLHAYFLRRGDFTAPIVYEVDRARDGRHFSMRRVVAIQHGEPIFNMSASFQAAETGLEHAAPMPDVPGPEALMNADDYLRLAGDTLTPKLRRLLERRRPFEFRPVLPLLGPETAAFSGLKHIWLRAVDALPDDEALHRSLLAYVSDFHLLETAMTAHGLSYTSGKLIVASIDHAMWFHRSVRVDDWLLYSTDSPSASGARGFARGSLYARDGRLVASTAQEGLMRPLDPAAAAARAAGVDVESGPPGAA
jgi:acyl-CoA thioesterase-2